MIGNLKEGKFIGLRVSEASVFCHSEEERSEKLTVGEMGGERVKRG